MVQPTLKLLRAYICSLLPVDWSFMDLLFDKRFPLRAPVVYLFNQFGQWRVFSSDDCLAHDVIYSDHFEMPRKKLRKVAPPVRAFHWVNDPFWQETEKRWRRLVDLKKKVANVASGQCVCIVTVINDVLFKRRHHHCSLCGHVGVRWDCYCGAKLASRCVVRLGERRRGRHCNSYVGTYEMDSY